MKMKSTFTQISILLFSALFLVSCYEDDQPIFPEDDNTPPPEEIVGVDFSGVYVQHDRIGRPAVANVFVSEANRVAFNTTLTQQMQAAFKDDILANLLALNPDFDQNGGAFLCITDENGDCNAIDAETLAGIFANDVLWVARFGNTTFYEDNRVFTGRKPADDVMNMHLKLIFAGPDINNPLFDGTDGQPLLISDGVEANDKPFSASFPYLAAPF